MSLVMPRLDDRHFQDLVNEAKNRITHYCPEWTDHNVSDPGVTLIELFAWMIDVLLYRLNQLPQAHAVKLMELFGINLQGPQPARGRITFWLSSPQSTPVVVPAGTEVSSTQTELDRPIIFTTDAELCIQPPELKAVLSMTGRQVVRQTAQPVGQESKPYEYNLRHLDAGFIGREVFSTPPAVDDALYFGFENDMSYHVLGFEMDFDPAYGAGIDPTLPPYEWQAWGGPEACWQRCDVEMDTTRGMNTAGRVRIHLPLLTKGSIDGKELYWVRVRVIEITQELDRKGMLPYRKSPRIRKASVHSIGSSVQATHARVVTQEFLGQSDGSPGQRFQLKFFPLLERLAGEHLVVQAENELATEWQEVSSFSASGKEDLHYTLDTVTGELRFGPAVRQPDGNIRLYGCIPAKNALLIFERYRYGGGTGGNVQAGVLNTLKTAIPFIARISNRAATSGGLDPETQEAAMLRLPEMLRSRERAVTEADYEFFARQALPGRIGRVKCIQTRPTDGGSNSAEQRSIPSIPGLVYLLVIPSSKEPEGYLEPGRLHLDEEEIAAITAFLDERRLLTARLEVASPEYHRVSVKVSLRPDPTADGDAIRAEVLRRLYRFLNPLTGGPEGTGWPFNRKLYVSDVYQCLQGIPKVQYISRVEMFEPRANGEMKQIETVEVIAHGVIVSGEHQVEFV